MGKKKNKIYIVYRGRKPGVYHTWDDCEAQVTGFSQAYQKGFADEVEADKDCRQVTGKSLKEMFGYVSQAEIIKLKTDISQRQQQAEKDKLKDQANEKIRCLQNKIKHDMQELDIPVSVEKFCRTYGAKVESIAHMSIDQKRALGQVEGHSLLFAVPGSGKTAVITARNGYLIHGPHGMNIDPSSIITLTFSRKAAEEMSKRYQKIFPEDKAGPVFKTIHSFCLTSILDPLRRKGAKYPALLINNIYEGKDETGKKYHFRLTAKRVIKEALDRIEVIMYLTEEQAEQLGSVISYIKNQQLAAKDIHGKKIYINNTNFDLEQFFNAYEYLLHEKYKAYDFDDMLKYSYDGLQKYPDLLQELRQRYNYWSIDEAQDNSPLQNNLLRLLTQAPNSLFMVGDDDQSIYAFRGSEPQLLMDYGLEAETRVMTMGTNYRSDYQLVNVSREFIRMNEIRADKEMTAFSAKQGRIKFCTLFSGANAQYDYILGLATKAWEDLQEKLSNTNQKTEAPLAILYRQHFSAVPVAFWLWSEHIPFHMSKGIKKIMQGKVFNQALKIIKLLANPNSYCSFVQGFHAFIGCKNAKDNPPLTKRQKQQLKALALDHPAEPVYKLYYDIIYEQIIQQAIADCKKETAESAVMDQEYAELSVTQIVENFLKNRDTKLKDLNQLQKMTTSGALAYLVQQRILSYKSERQSERMRIYAILSAAFCYDRLGDFIQAYEELCQLTAEKTEENEAEQNYDALEDENESEDLETSEIAKAENPGDDQMQNQSLIMPDCVPVELMSMHASKGLQYDRVIMIDCLEPQHSEPAPDEFVIPNAGEDRRLFYVAMTRAKHQLDLLLVQEYYGNIEQAARFIQEAAELLEQETQREVVQYPAAVNTVKKDPDLSVKSCYVVISGRKQGIYDSWTECEKNVNGFPGAMYKKFYSLAEAQDYWEQSMPETKSDKLCTDFLDDIILPQATVSFNKPMDLPVVINEAITKHFKVNNLKELAARRFVQMNFSGGIAVYDNNTADSYLLNYLPVNFYKIYLPLSQCLAKSYLPLKAMVIEIGPGPGTSTLAMMMFYTGLAENNPDKQFSLTFLVVENSRDNIKVMCELIGSVKKYLPANLKFAGSARCENINEKLALLPQENYDLLIESNVYNNHEDTTENMDVKADCMANLLKKNGRGIFIEPAGINKLIWKSLNKCSKLTADILPQNSRVDISKVSLKNLAVEMGLRRKNLLEHRFSYGIWAKK